MDFVFSLPALICFVIGLVLLIIEVLTPGIGIPGAAGVVLLIAGIIFQAQNLKQALLLIVIMLLIVSAALIIIVKRGGSGKIKAGGVILGDSIEKEGNDFSGLIGCRGIAGTALRPSGTVSIDGKQYDVVSGRGFIPEGTEVEVIQTDGMRIVVAPINERKDN